MSRNVLFADLYQMTMLRAYFELGMAEEASARLISTFVQQCSISQHLSACYAVMRPTTSIEIPRHRVSNVA